MQETVDLPAWPSPPPRRLERVRARAGTAGSRATLALSHGRAAAGRTAARASGVVRDRSGRLTAASLDATRQIVTHAGPEVRASVVRLGTVRSPQAAVDALEREIEHLMVVVAPLLVAHPLPVRNPAVARVVVGGAAAAVAVGEELDEVAALFSAGASIAPSVPVLVTAAFLSLGVEVSVATSLRVHDLRAAAASTDPTAVTRDVVFAMAGSKGAARAAVTRQFVKRIAARVLARWGTGLVPVIGAGYSAWDAQQTIGAIRRLPAPFHRPASAPIGLARVPTPAAPAPA